MQQSMDTFSPYMYKVLRSVPPSCHVISQETIQPFLIKVGELHIVIGNCIRVADITVALFPVIQAR